MNIYIDLEDNYSWYKLSKVEQIKTQYQYLMDSCSCLISYEENLRDWRLLTESIEFLSLDEALEKFKEPKRNIIYNWLNIIYLLFQLIHLSKINKS